MSATAGLGQRRVVRRAADPLPSSVLSPIRRALNGKTLMNKTLIALVAASAATFSLGAFADESTAQASVDKAQAKADYKSDKAQAKADLKANTN